MRDSFGNDSGNSILCRARDQPCFSVETMAVKLEFYHSADALTASRQWLLRAAGSGMLVADSPRSQTRQNAKPDA